MVQKSGKLTSLRKRQLKYVEIPLFLGVYTFQVGGCLGFQPSTVVRWFPNSSTPEKDTSGQIEVTRKCWEFTVLECFTAKFAAAKPDRLNHQTTPVQRSGQIGPIFS